LIIDAARQGLRGERLLDVSTAVLHEVQRGHSQAEAMAVVRRELPNVPPPPKPAGASVAGARRPGTGALPPPCRLAKARAQALEDGTRWAGGPATPLPRTPLRGGV